MVKYAKCPRCELNYIDITKQQYCEVCVKEMKGLIEDDPILEDEDETEMELCPVCGENMMRVGEKMCEDCKKKSEYDEDVGAEEDPENDEEWRNYLDDEPAETEDIGVSEDEIEPDEEEEEEEFESVDEEDFEYVTGDDIYKFSDDDDFDDEDEDDDFDDEETDKKEKGKRRKAMDGDDF